MHVISACTSAKAWMLMVSINLETCTYNLLVFIHSICNHAWGHKVVVIRRFLILITVVLGVVAGEGEHHKPSFLSRWVDHEVVSWFQ